MYSFETKDNEGLKKLFSDLSNHKPIFADDRLGRRMTLEKTFNFKVSPHAQPESPIRTGQSRYGRVHLKVKGWDFLTCRYLCFYMNIRNASAHLNFCSPSRV